MRAFLHLAIIDAWESTAPGCIVFCERYRLQPQQYVVHDPGNLYAENGEFALTPTDISKRQRRVNILTVAGYCLSLIRQAKDPTPSWCEPGQGRPILNPFFHPPEIDPLLSFSSSTSSISPFKKYWAHALLPPPLPEHSAGRGLNLSFLLIVTSRAAASFPAAAGCRALRPGGRHARRRRIRLPAVPVPSGSTPDSGRYPPRRPLPEFRPHRAICASSSSAFRLPCIPAKMIRFGTVLPQLNERMLKKRLTTSVRRPYL